MALILLLLTPSQAGADAIKGEIAQLSAAHDAAIMAREAKALEKLLDQEFQYINENGEYDKAGYIAGFTDKKLTLDSIKSGGDPRPGRRCHRNRHVPGRMEGGG